MPKHFLSLFLLLASLGLWGSADSFAREPSKLLRVMSYNIQGVPDPRLDQSRFPDIGRELAHQRELGIAPEIVVIQEAFTALTGDVAYFSGYPYVATGPGPNPFGLEISSGLMILSEYPIVEKKSSVYQNCTGIDCFARKSVTQFQIAVPWMSEPLEMYTTHLNATPDDENPGDARWVNVRKAQSSQSLQFMAKVTDTGRAAIFGGDFNFSPGFADYDQFSDGILNQFKMINAGLACAKLGNCIGVNDPAHEVAQAIDHQFYRSSTAYKVYPVSFAWKFTDPVNGRMLSDHQALEVVYRFVPRQ